MPEEKKKAIADAADMIVGGYAFLKKKENIVIVNLNSFECNAMMIDWNGRMLESCMEPLEQVIALKKWYENSQFLEV